MSPALMDGRVCIVTGPTSGIGEATAFGLARLGADLVLACRDVRKGEKVRETIARETGNPNAEVLPLNLASLRSVRSFAKAFEARQPSLHVLVNNAGIFSRQRRTTEDGLESQFQVNYLGHFLLTHLLIGALKAGAPSRIVNVSSEAHRGAKLDFEDLQTERRFSGYRTYGESKLAQIVFTHELARRLAGTGITVNALHPGVIRTNLGKGEFPAAFGVVRLVLRGPKSGARTSIHVATSPALEGVSGKYFSKSAEAISSPESYNVESERRLWDLSMRLAGLAA